MCIVGAEVAAAQVSRERIVWSDRSIVNRASHTSVGIVGGFEKRTVIWRRSTVPIATAWT